MKIIELFLPRKEDRPDFRTILVLISIPVVLTLMEFMGMPWHFLQFFPQVRRIFSFEAITLMPFIYWSCFCGVAYLGIPALLTRWVFSEGIVQYGLRLKGITRHLWI